MTQKNITLLIVDDDNITRKLVTKSLSKDGFNVIDAADGQTAIHICKEKCPDLVILDVMMPKMDGYTTCRLIREFADDASLPIVMLTGSNDVESVEKAYQAGATDFITKPVQWTLLSQRVKYAIRNRDMKKEIIVSQIKNQQAQKLAKLGYIEITDDKRITFSNETIEILGIESNESSLSEFIDSLCNDDKSSAMSTIENSINNKKGYMTEFRMIINNQESFLLSNTEYVIDNYTNAGKLIGTIQDITQYKEVSKRLDYQLRYDSLTDLPNRNSFNKHLSSEIDNASKNEKLLSVLLISIDEFKKIIESFGHENCDNIIHTMSDILKSISEKNIFISRFSSESFAIIASNISHIDSIDSLSENILKSLSNKDYMINESPFHITISIGISVYPLESDSESELMRGAEVALQYSKQNGGNQANYVTSEMNKRNHEKFQLEKDLRVAYEKKQFELYYQPKICSKTERIVGAEALIRWHHPQRGLIFPDVFIGLAEEIGLISDIGCWVLRQAASQAKYWSDSGLGDFVIGVNMSSIQFADPDLLEKLEIIVEDTKISPNLIDIEVTESIAINNFEDIHEILTAIQSMGFHTAMDDFGTGYSSLSYLQKLPLNSLKIDRAFIKDIGKNGENGDIASAILAMAHSLGLEVVAEGVETLDQLNFLRKQQCDIIQGYYYSKPIPAREFEIFAQKMRTAA
ncbi:MAG: EAL domain-containing protein [Gammaproteobacteria bacterium]|nr:EAL domain-containing protein [Gammaproteobacteria bacterium]